MDRLTSLPDGKDGIFTVSSQKIYQSFTIAVNVEHIGEVFYSCRKEQQGCVGRNSSLPEDIETANQFSFHKLSYKTRQNQQGAEG